MQISKLNATLAIFITTMACLDIPEIYAATLPTQGVSTSSDQATKVNRSIYISSELQRSIESAASAEEVYNKIEQMTALDEIQAKNWGLTKTEWIKYKTIMATTPRGNWTPNLDPITTLGSEAKTQEERDRYAKLFFDTESERQSKEIRFNYTVVEYYCSNHPESNLCKSSEQIKRETLIEAEKAIALSEIKARSPENNEHWSPVRYSLFVDLNAYCDESCELYLSDTTRTLPYLDITIANAGENGISQFIEKYKIDRNDLLTKKTTITQGSKPDYLKDPLPVAYKVIDGEVWGRVERRKVQ